MPITLTTGDDDVLVEAPLSSFINGSTTSLAGITVDGSDGIDVLTIDTSIIIDTHTLNMSADGTLSLTTAGGTASFVNFETLYIEGVLTDIGTLAGEALTGTIDDDLYLFGLGGSDTIDGGAGADKMYGGLGDDTYIVDNAGDSVIEVAGEGIDTVRSSVSFTLGANVENLVLTGFTSINATGNGLANRLTGNATANVLDGGAGADTLVGAGGADSYYVDNAGDVIIEKAGEGVDVVTASVSYVMHNNVENVILTGTAKSATGNVLNNRITGNDANNVIDGGLGVDNMNGGKGDDVYYVNQTIDTVYESTGQGNDTVHATASFTLSLGVENLILDGTAALYGRGSSGNNTITGNSAANILTGGLGRDLLTGGGGKDVFDFNTQIDSGRTGPYRDVITDFAHLVDKIDLSGIDANSLIAGNQTFMLLGSKGGAFTGKPSELRYLAAGTDTLIEGDTNGDKVADFQIQLTGNKVLTAADFVL